MGMFLRCLGLLLLSVSVASTEECTSPPETELDPHANVTGAGESCTPPTHSTCSTMSTPGTYSTESTLSDLCETADRRRLLRSSPPKEAREERDLLDIWGRWDGADSWLWYFCGGGTDVPLTMTGWEPAVKALWMKRHAKTMVADICGGTLSKTYSIGRWDSILTLGTTWIGGFALKMTAVKVGTVTRNGNCYNKYFVTVSFDDHFDCDPGGGNKYWVRHKWYFNVYCKIGNGPCTTTSTTTSTTITTASITTTTGTMSSPVSAPTTTSSGMPVASPVY